MEKLKLKLFNWLVNSLNIKFIGFKIDSDARLDMVGNIPIEDFEQLLNLVKELEKIKKINGVKNGNKGIN